MPTKADPVWLAPGGPVPTLAAEEKLERWGDLHSKNKSKNENKDTCADTLGHERKRKHLEPEPVQMEVERKHRNM